MDIFIHGYLSCRSILARRSIEMLADVFLLRLLTRFLSADHMLHIDEASCLVLRGYRLSIWGLLSCNYPHTSATVVPIRYVRGSHCTGSRRNAHHHVITLQPDAVAVVSQHQDAHVHTQTNTIIRTHTNTMVMPDRFTQQAWGKALPSLNVHTEACTLPGPCTLPACLPATCGPGNLNDAGGGVDTSGERSLGIPIHVMIHNQKTRSSVGIRERLSWPSFWRAKGQNAYNTLSGKPRGNYNNAQQPEREANSKFVVWRAPRQNQVHDPAGLNLRLLKKISWIFLHTQGKLCGQAHRRKVLQGIDRL